MDTNNNNSVLIPHGTHQTQQVMGPLDAAGNDTNATRGVVPPVTTNNSNAALSVEQQLLGMREQLKALESELERAKRESMRSTTLPKVQKPASLSMLKGDLPIDWVAWNEQFIAMCVSNNVFTRSEFDEVLEGNKTFDKEVVEWLFNVIVSKISSTLVSTHVLALREPRNGVELYKRLRDSYLGGKRRVLKKSNLLRDMLSVHDIDKGLQSWLGRVRFDWSQLSEAGLSVREDHLVMLLLDKLRETKFGPAVSTFIATCGDTEILTLLDLEQKLQDIIDVGKFSNDKDAENSGPMVNSMVGNKRKRSMAPNEHNGRPSKRNARPCHRCGKSGHNPNDCKAKSVKCNKCHKIGHYEVACRTGSMNNKVSDREEKAPEPSNTKDVVGSINSLMVNEKVDLEDNDKLNDDLDLLFIYIDSCATHSATRDGSVLTNIQTHHKTFEMAAGKEMFTSSQKGELRGALQDIGGVFHMIQIQNVHIVPHLNRTILAVADCIAGGHTVHLGKTRKDSYIETKKGVRIPLTPVGRVWRLPIYLPKDRHILQVFTYKDEGGNPKDHVVAVHSVEPGILKGEANPHDHMSADTMVELTTTMTKPERAKATMIRQEGRFLRWHQRLAHLNFWDLKKLLVASYPKEGYEDIDLEKGNIQCEVCMAAKAKRTPDGRKKHAQRSTKPYEFIHSDCVPITPISQEGYQHAVFFVDDYTSETKVYFMSAANGKTITLALKAYIIECGGLNKFKNSTIQSDKGIYKSDEFIRFCNENMIRTKWSTPYHQAYNGTAERKVAVVISWARCMIIESGIAVHYWPYAVAYAAMISNLISTRKRPQSPYEMLTGKKPDLSLIRRFGCVCYIVDNTAAAGKFTEKGILGVFMGIARNESYGTYIIGIPSKKSIRHSRDVYFVEDRLYYKSVSDTTFNIREARSKLTLQPVELLGETKSDAVASETMSIDSLSDIDEEELTNGHSISDSKMGESTGSQTGYIAVFNNTDEDPKEILESVCGAKYVRSAYSALGENYLNAIKDDEESIENQDQTLKPRNTIPTSYKSISRLVKDKEEWLGALSKEFQGLKDLKTFKAVKRSTIPADAPIVPLKTIFTEKSDGTKKARVCLRGDLMDFYEGKTYAPTSSIENWRMILAIESFLRKYNRKGKKYKRIAFDVKNAFLNAGNDVVVYADPPEGYYDYFEPSDEDWVWIIVKALYGEPQAPLLWYKEYRKRLIELGLHPLENDPCIFVKFDGANDIELLMNLHVDDSFVIGQCTQVDTLVEKVKDIFSIKELGDPSHFLGTQVEVDAEGDVMINQEKMIQKLIRTFGIAEANITNLPHIPNHRLEHVSNGVKGLPYQSLVGAKLWIARTSRPDLSYNVMSESRHLINHTNEHFRAAKMGLRYLKGTSRASLRIKASENVPIIELFVDADHAGDKTDPKQRSIAGYIIYLFGCPIIWNSTVEKSTALSACDAEIIATCDALKKAYALAKILVELHLFDTEDDMKIVAHVDNQACKKTLENQFGTSRTRHLNIQMAWIRDLVERGVVEFQYVKSADNVADIFTKPLTREPYYRHARKMIDFRDA